MRTEFEIQLAARVASEMRELRREAGIKDVQPVDYIDPAPRQLIPQIPLWEYFERIKRVKADAWQKDFCNRLQKASVNRHVKQTLAITHAEAQIGKSVIQAQVFVSWLLGHDPEHKIILATYNVGKSEDHSIAIINAMQSDTHKAIFPNKGGHIPDGRISRTKWSTFARMEVNDGQHSFRAVGLQSGITGSGFQTGIIDDPYSNVKDAFSPTIRKGLQNFWDTDIMPRLDLHSNIFAMFHRYNYDDLAGYLLSKGYFDYWRYATMCDGDFIDDRTGQRFTDPINRKIGEYISPERRKPEQYEKVKKNNRVWLSMNQGRPSAVEGEFFNVGKISIISTDEAVRRKANCVALVRAWDLAATEKGGDYSVGMLIGMESDGRTTIFDNVREQVETSGRDALQLATAKKDGKDVVITVPDDPGAGGTTTVFHIQQLLKGYEVVPRSTTGAKADRARNFAGAVNSGEVSFADDSWMPEDKRWIETTKLIFRDFPLADFDDDVDSAGDGYNECFERKVKGLVVQNIKPRNIIGWRNFQQIFPDIRPSQAIPKHWRIYVGVRITDEASKPNSALIVARASINANIGECLLVLAEYKKYDNNYTDLFNWLNVKLTNNFSRTPKENVRIFLHEDSKGYLPTIKQKLNFNIHLFKQDNISGLSEINWYLTRTLKPHPFYQNERATGLYLIVADDQLSVASNESGLINIRQEFSTWGFNDKGEPSQVGQVAECLRMIAYGFKTYAEPLTDNEIVEAEIAKRVPGLSLVNIAKDGKGITAGAQGARFEEEARVRRQLGIEKRDVDDFMNEDMEIW